MGARILVADDSVTIQKVVELTFSKEDFVLTQARSGEEAIRKAKETRPDLVLLDLVMPDMNGYDVCAALRTDPALRSVPIILLAGTFESFDHQRGTQAGANDFVTKPFESQVLIGKVKQLLFAKAMETGSVGTAPKPLAGAVTVKIPSAPSAPSVVPPTPDATLPADQRLPPAPPSIPPQDELWQLLGSSSDPTPPAAQPVERSEASPEPVAAFAGLPAEPEGPPLDLSALDLAPLPGESPSPADAMDVLSLPESLSLDDLLAAGPEGPAASAARETATEGETAPLEPVFDLSAAEAPPLAMVEAGKGEPPALSVDDLLGPAGGDTAPADTLTMELSEFDLAPLPEAGAPPMADFAAAPPAFPQVEEALSELPLQEAAEPRMEAAAVEMAGSVGPSEFLSSIRTSGESPGLTEGPASETSADATVPRAADAPTVPTTAGLVAEGAAPTVPVGASPSDLAALRDAVTERVAHDLRRDLSEKLLERFEKIVWEVVPDMAEILITKEIERIRRLAEEEKPS